MGLTAVFGLLRGIPLLVWPLLAVTGLWQWERHEVKSLKNQMTVEAAERANAQVEANEIANRWSARYEELLQAKKTRTIYVTRKVTDAITQDTTGWGGGAIPDGVRSAISQAAADIATGQPGSPMPAASGAGPKDEPGTGLRLPGKPGLMERLFGKAPQPRPSTPQGD